jgi:hypothetical protein
MYNHPHRLEIPEKNAPSATNNGNATEQNRVKEVKSPLNAGMNPRTMIQTNISFPCRQIKTRL